MKIIKEGALPDETIEVQQTCYKCGTVFSFTKEDVQSDLRGDSYVKCPYEKCGAYNDSSPIFDAIKKDRLKRLNDNANPQPKWNGDQSGYSR